MTATPKYDFPVYVLHIGYADGVETFSETRICAQTIPELLEDIDGTDGVLAVYEVNIAEQSFRDVSEDIAVCWLNSKGDVSDHNQDLFHPFILNSEAWDKHWGKGDGRYTPSERVSA